MEETDKTSEIDFQSGSELQHVHEREVRMKSRWRTTVESFSPMWFAIVMNTGILAVLLHNLPYQFRGSQVLATILYVFDIVLFAPMMFISILRWTLFREDTLKKTKGNLDELSAHACMPIAFLTIAALTALIPSNAQWGGHAFALLAYILWWVATAWSLVTLITVCAIIFRSEVTSHRTISTTLVIPCVSVSTDAVVGCLICRYGNDISARLAVPVIIVSYMLDGMALFLSLAIYAIYTHHLMVIGWPEGSKRATLFLLIGPFGQTAAALLLASSTAQKKMVFADYDKGTFLTVSGAMSASGTSVVIALLLLGYDTFWICIAVYGVLEGAWKRQLTYNLSWWGTIFPLATTATSFLVLSEELDSPAFRALTTAIFLFLVIDYFINWGYTLYFSIFGDLLFKQVEKVVTVERKIA